MNPLGGNHRPSRAVRKSDLRHEDQERRNGKREFLRYPMLCLFVILVVSPQY